MCALRAVAIKRRERAPARSAIDGEVPQDAVPHGGPNMPPKGPKPTLDQYLSILAFDLKANGVDLTGKPALTPDNLSAIVIHP